jgi:hypothetical protein
MTKQLVYRASTYTARDAFDLAAIYLLEPSALEEIAKCPAITDPVLAKRQYQADMRNLINVTRRGEEFIDRACEIALEALRRSRSSSPRRRRRRRPIVNRWPHGFAGSSRRARRGPR